MHYKGNNISSFFNESRINRENNPSRPMPPTDVSPHIILKDTF